jgi:hypothetical protein
MKGFWVFFFTSVLVGCGGSANNSGPPPPQQNQLTVSVAGKGTVNSNPAGISCPTTCKASFNSGTMITLTTVAASGFSFSGFSGACSGTSCQLTLNNNQNVSATFKQSTPPPPTATLENSVNHIIFMLQENRSFDHYFGHLPDRWHLRRTRLPDPALFGLELPSADSARNDLSGARQSRSQLEDLQN